MDRIKLSKLLSENVNMTSGNVRLDSSTGFIYHGDNIILTDEDVTELGEALNNAKEILNFNDRYELRPQFEIIDTIDGIVHYISQYDVEQMLRLQEKYNISSRDEFAKIENNQRI